MAQEIDERPGSLPRRAPPLVMGILNVTPDSFYAGSRLDGRDAAVRRGMEMLEEGADLLDVGGESTRPGAEPVAEEEENRRAVPVVAELARRAGVPVSIDTSKAGVARRALEAGATILNDVSALRGDARMPEAARAYPRVILMHMRGNPKTMQDGPRYADVVREISDFFLERLEAFERAGGDPTKVWLDPGIGFGKEPGHNLEILRRLEEFRALGRPLVLGASRKSFIGRLLATGQSPAAAPLPPEERLEGSLAVACRAALAGIEVLRVHDVGATRRALKVFAAVQTAAVAA